MAEKHFNAPSRARSGVSATVHPIGVVHVRHRHTERFTVVGNHLAQHRALSLTAIGLAVHIQSLPDGARIGIKALAARFPHGEVALASALRELEAHGYLSRLRERGPGGRWVTRTVAYEMPSQADAGEGAGAGPGADAGSGREPAQHRDRELGLGLGLGRKPEPDVRAVPVPVPVPAPTPPRPAAPLLPEPERVDSARQHAAGAILAGLRRRDPRLVLSERDVVRLTPAVSAWLERGVEAAAVELTLTTLLPPDAIPHPAALLAHRLIARLPPPLPAAPAASRRPDPLQNCDRCDRAYRAPEPGCCRGCLPGESPPGAVAA